MTLGLHMQTQAKPCRNSKIKNEEDKKKEQQLQKQQQQQHRHQLTAPSELSSPSLSSSSSSSSSFSSFSSCSSADKRLSQLDQKRRARSFYESFRHDSQILSSPTPTVTSIDNEAAPLSTSCSGRTEFATPEAPDLLQLFNIFQFNTPEITASRVLVTVSLIGSILPIRLLVRYDASVQDVIRASLKAYAKEGRVPRHSHKNPSYGLHYSPFCLESIDPTESICNLGTRSFYLSPSIQDLSIPLDKPKEGKRWWNILSLFGIA